MAANEAWVKLVTNISDQKDTDYYLFSGQIYENQSDRLIETVRKLKRKRTNGALILCTPGGNADCAYQIARLFRRRYKKFILYVFGHCKSAGTLIAVGANEIVMSEFGQFGPLDVQLADKEELFGQTPALDVQQSLITLSRFTFDTFFDYFLKLDPGKSLSTKTASEIAKTLAVGIATPMAAQIEPLLLGRVDRSMKIAEAYSDRLNKDFGANKSTLSGGYPSHSFVIDYEEAKTIFPLIREPDEAELELENMLRGWKRVPVPQAEWVGLISPEKSADKEETHETTKATVESGTNQPTKTASDAAVATATTAGK